MVFLTIVFGLFLASSGVSAFGLGGGEGGGEGEDENVVVDRVNLFVPPSCSLSGTGENSHNATISPGTYNSEIGTTTLKAICNDSEGFAIYAIGYTNDMDGNNTLASTTLATPITINTGTATSGNSQWAMKLATNSEASYPIELQNGFGAFHTVPDDYMLVAKRMANTDAGTAAIGSVLTTTYQVFVSNMQPADTYTGKVKYVMVHSATHSAPVVCNPNATTISEVKCMQDFGNVDSTNRAAILASMTAGQQYTMQDKRDGKTYTIAKLADGNVWMTQNLDLDLVAGDTYTNEDTDIGYNTTTGEYETAAWSPIRSTYATSSSQSTTWCQGGTWNSQYGYCESNNTPESYDPGDFYWNSTLSDYNDWGAYDQTCDYSTSTLSCSGTSPIGTYISSTGTAQYHLGNYYNWTAAVAMNDSSSYTTQNELIEQSICPVGWTLPRTRTGDDTFYSLWNDYDMVYSSFIDVNGNLSYDNGEMALWTSPLYFSASGVFDGVLFNVGGDGSFWSSVVNDEFEAWAAGFAVNGSISSSNNDYRGGGYSIRCVARPVSSSISVQDAL